jgi:outer membrane protein assembly factor BamB
VAGEWLFVVTDEGKLIALHRGSGRIRWINELPRWRDMKGKKDPIFYYGPVLAGDRLIVAGSNGVLVNVDPANGSFQSQTNVGAGVNLPPVVAGQTLYILDERGRLTAFR